MRHELKYLVSEKQLEELRFLLGTVMTTDENQSEDGYTIRSVYFDTFDDRFFYETLNGTDKRSKYRIRIYDCSDKMIKLEKKITVNSLKTKEVIEINKEEATSVINGDLQLNKKPLLSEIAMISKTEGLLPTATVEYDRYAFVSDVGNVRITFDRNIRASSETDIFSKNILFIPVLPQGKHILEVKYDGVLPGYIAKMLNLHKLERISYSKYLLSRNCINNNGRILETYEY